MSLTISKQVMRRFILGRQGLWPGRRWAGQSGTAKALRTCEAVQIDPLNVVVRNHDLTLWGRVANYKPEYLDRLLYRERAFFDYGGALFIYPMGELPYWRVVMQRKGREKRWADFMSQNPKVIDAVRREIRMRGPLSNRDFEGDTHVSSFRSGKATGLALYSLWLRGEVMTHGRRNFERLYDLSENVVPPEFNVEASVEEAERFFARKALAFRGLASARSWRGEFAGTIERPVNPVEAQEWLNEMLEAKEMVAVQVEDIADPWYALASDAPILEALNAGRVPKAWTPIDMTTEQEVVFLAPLDIVSARGRAKVLFDFDYVWEVYKPASKRRWGYYTLPILYGDRLVARLDPKLDRERQTLVIKGFWLEDSSTAKDAAFANALARGLTRFAHFLEADRVDLSAVQPASLRRHVQKVLAKTLEA